MKDLYKFLSALKRNNNREWFQAHKSEFDTLENVFVFMVQELIDRISLFDKSITGVSARSCIFRIYRDMRFSYDKTPYKTHRSVWITRGGRKSDYPGYYLHLEPGNTFIAVGIWHPKPGILKAVRRDIFDNIEEFKSLVLDPEFVSYYGTLQGEMVKKVPAGYPAGFEDDYYIRFKEYFAIHSLGDNFFDENWIQKCADIYQIGYPLNDFMANAVDNVVL